MSFMLSVTNEPFMLSVIMLNVVMLSVVARLLKGVALVPHSVSQLVSMRDYYINYGHW